MIFNSLGSNYNFRFAVKVLTAGGSDKNNLELKKYLEKNIRDRRFCSTKGERQ